MKTVKDRATPTAREMRRFCVSTIEVRKTGEATTEIDIEGYASITDTPYEVYDFMGKYDETISAGAFKKTLEEKDDVRLLFNHDGIPVARSKSGTMSLEEDKKGLKVNATLDTRSGLANDLVVALERGDLDEMSFAFKVIRQEWNEDYTERWIKEVKLFDTSIVTYPANPDTSVGLRAAQLFDQLDDEALSAFLRQRGYVKLEVPAPGDSAGRLALRRRQLALANL